MSVLNKHIQIKNLRDVQVLLLGITVSVLLLGYAFSSISLVIFIIYSLGIFFLEKKKVYFRPRLLLPIILYLFLSLTYFWSVNQQLTITGLFRVISLLLVPCTFLLIPPFSKKEIRIILKIFTFANLVFATFFLISAALRYLKTNSFNEFTYHDLVQSLELNAVYVSAYFSLSFYYLISIKNKKTILWVLALFLLINIFLLSSKTILFIVLITGVIYLINSRKHFKSDIKKKWHIITILVLIVAFASKPIFKRIVEESSSNFKEVLHKEKFNKVYPWTGTSFRLLQLRILKDQIKEEKILHKGFGLFASRESLKNKHIEFNTYPGYHTYNYHNMYAQVLSESGIIGLLLLIIMIFSFLKAAIKSKSLIFLFFGILILIWFFSESVLWVHRGVLFFVIFYSLFIGLDISADKLKKN